MKSINIDESQFIEAYDETSWIKMTNLMSNDTKTFSNK